MKPDQAEELLSLISSIDRKPFPPGAVPTWYEILHNIDFNDAKQAVHEHYTSLGARDHSGNARPILPVDIKSRANAIREVRERARRAHALPAPRVRLGSTGRPAEVLAELEAARERAAQAARKFADVAA